MFDVAVFPLSAVFSVFFFKINRLCLVFIIQVVFSLLVVCWSSFLTLYNRAVIECDNKSKFECKFAYKNITF